MADLFGSTHSPATAAQQGSFALVALEQGIDNAEGGLTYLVPPELEPLHVGQRVSVPLGRSRRAVAGYVLQRLDTCDYRQVRSIISREGADISLPSDLIELARWIGAYYCSPLGMVLATMLPAAVKKGTGSVTQLRVALVDPLPTPLPRLSPLQQAVIAALQASTQQDEPWLEIRSLADLAGARSIAPVKQLIEKQLLQTRRQATVNAQWDQMAAQTQDPRQPVTLNPAQQQAVDQLIASLHQGFGVHLLQGVTGSGKTEVYLRTIEHLLAHTPADGPGVIALVPEIALTPQMAARFQGRLAQVAVLHSGLTAAQRHDQWQRIRTGQARVVVGARSAIFAPLPRLGLVIVDEEHESSYKQDQLPRYHARDVAIKRAQLAGVPVVLGSATPSIESYANAQLGRFNLLRLPERVAGLQLPRVQLVNMVEERRRQRGINLISGTLEQALNRCLARGGQGLLLLNRRGYANYIACPDHHCGWQLNCSYCDVLMVYHKDRQLATGGYVRCHHCDAQQMLPPLCPVCQKKVIVFGLGTQRVEEELQRKFPLLAQPGTLARMDSDTMRTSRDYQQTLHRFGLGEIRVLLGTQMIAKGLDFPNVQVVGVISADTALHMPDFRAAERTFQLIAQVAGRAGRGREPGTVVVQTFNPDDPSILLAASHDYETFAGREWTLRQENKLPPASRMARIVIRDQDQQAVELRARKLATQLGQANDQLGQSLVVRGPSPCSVARIAGFFRYQIEIFSHGQHAAMNLQKLLQLLRLQSSLHADHLTAVDVDPVVLL